MFTKETVNRIRTELEKYSNDELRTFFTAETNDKLPDGFIKDFIKEGAKGFEMGKRINEVERISIDIVIKRFIAKKIN